MNTKTREAVRFTGAPLPFPVRAFFFFIGGAELHQTAAAHTGAVGQEITGLALGQTALIQGFRGFVRRGNAFQQALDILFIVRRKRFPQQAFFTQRSHGLFDGQMHHAARRQGSCQAGIAHGEADKRLIGHRFRLVEGVVVVHIACDHAAHHMDGL